jgi:DinB superfamily
MTLDKSYVEQNRASTERIRKFAKSSDEELQHRVDEQWTVAITLAHLAFWDRRAMYVLDRTEPEGKLSTLEIDTTVNDIGLPLFAAIPPREAPRLAIEEAEALDKRIERFPSELLEQIYNYNKRYVIRALHRNEQLDDVDRALNG